MGLQLKDFDNMTDNVLTKIVNSNIGITNINDGSVIRTIVESIMSELDIQQFNVKQVYNAKCIDTSIGSDLDALVMILGIIRKPATKCIGVVTFSMTEPSINDIYIEYAQIISTVDGNIQFIVTDDNAYIPAGQLSVNVNVEAIDAGNIFIPANALCVMNTPIIGIESVYNADVIYGGTNTESDEDVRVRAKNALQKLGRGTNIALENGIMDIIGVIDVSAIDMARGIGTTDLIIVTDTIPPSDELSAKINETIIEIKPAGIDVAVIYPTLVPINVSVNRYNSIGDIDDIGNAIVQYFETLKISDSFIINQMERYILSECNVHNMDISTVSPTDNISVLNTEIISCGTITIDGVIWNG